jgi:pimeloyl-ACP methyl ester carboxylesterase
MTDSPAQPFAPLEREYPAVIASLTSRGADSLAHPGGTLLAHLKCTARALESRGASRDLVAAGLCHAAYGTQGYPTPLFEVADRAVLRELIGDGAEAIVYAYGSLDRAHHLAQASGTRTHEGAYSGEIRDRFSGEYWTPPDHLQRQLAELTLANELDVLARAQLSDDEVAAIASMISVAAPRLSQAGWSAVLAEPQLRAALRLGVAPSCDAELAYRDLGTRGPRVVLWHGGGAPELTWSRQHALSTTLALRIPWRRGFAPSTAAVRQDWEVDARDLLRVMPDRAHVVAHSYGGVSAVVAATLAPERFGSLTVIEAPLWSLAVEDPEIQQLAELGRAFANGAPEARAAFLALAGLPANHPQTVRTERLARDFRDPGEAVPELSRLRAYGLPIAVASGGHNTAIERLSDAFSTELGAKRWVLAGAGHAVPRQTEFNDHLLAFIAALE